MVSKEYYIKYRDYQPVPVDTHFFNDQEGRKPLAKVAHLIAAYKTAVAPLFDSTPIDELTLHPCEGYDRISQNSVDEECFYSMDSADTSFRPGCKLSALADLGSNARKPLIIFRKR